MPAPPPESLPAMVSAVRMRQRLTLATDGYAARARVPSRRQSAGNDAGGGERA